MEIVDRAPGHGGRHLPHQVALQRLRGHGLGLPHGVPGQALLPSPTLVHKGLGNRRDWRENFDLSKSEQLFCQEKPRRSILGSNGLIECYQLKDS